LCNSITVAVASRGATRCGERREITGRVSKFVLHASHCGYLRTPTAVQIRAALDCVTICRSSDPRRAE
jgi:hypothetical protein